jgi:SAM-dependent methyltransferase
MSIVDLAKKIPLDLGQGNLRFNTKGKLIARDLVPRPPRPGAVALDVGCREGAQTRWLEALGYEVTSIDVEPAFERASVVDADRPLPYPTGSFDLVWCSEVIEHLKDPAASLSELRRVLRRGGTLVVTTPNSRAWFYRALALVGLPPRRLQHPGHKHFFGEQDMRALFPRGRFFGYFPYAIVKERIEERLAWLTPTFVVAEEKE